jgi:hypothetical protein
MFDQYILVEDTLRNVVNDGVDVGFEVGLRLPYYRGLGLSMVEDIALEVDGEPVDRAATTLVVHGNSYRLDAMAGVFDDRWEMGEVATLRVDRPGGLVPGPHEVAVSERLRISYMPVPGGGSDRKQLTLG